MEPTNQLPGPVGIVDGLRELAEKSENCHSVDELLRVAAALDRQIEAQKN